MTAVVFYLHNKDQFFDPNRHDVFGSLHEIIVLQRCNRSIGCHRRFTISRTYWNAMNYKEQPCDETGTANNTRQCISNFIRDKVGCYIPMQKMEPGGKPTCNRPDQYKEILKLTSQLTLADTDSDIYQLTGCLSSCAKVYPTIGIKIVPLCNKYSF